jgi:predicted RNA-binding Zn ribbon-like protein
VLRLTAQVLPEIDSPDDYAGGGKILYEALSSLPDVDRAVDRINVFLREIRAAPQLVRIEQAPWHLHFGPTEQASGWLADFGTAVAMLLGSGEVDRLRRCCAERCDDLFLDTTRNRTQRFCSTSCQNRTKVASFRARTSC